MRVTILIASALAIGLTGCAKLEARDLIREGNRLYGDGQYRDAIAKYSEAERLEPDGVTLYWNRAAAAESLVLKMKDPKQLEERHKLADLALQDYQTWFDRVDPKTEEDKQLLHDHRLALLDADERCDDLLSYWLEKHRANAKEEALYSVVARQYEKCDRIDKADEWFVKRTEDFPTSVRAWHSLAIRRFEPLWPQPDSGIPYNDQLSPEERIRIADDVIALLDKATAVDPKFRDAYIWRSMAYTQRSLARRVIDKPKTPEEKLEAILAREDSLLAWKQQKAICDLEEMAECPSGDVVPTTPCCPAPPLTAEEQATDGEMKQKLMAAVESANRKGARSKRKR